MSTALTFSVGVNSYLFIYLFELEKISLFIPKLIFENRKVFLHFNNIKLILILTFEQKSDTLKLCGPSVSKHDIFPHNLKHSREKTYLF